MPGHDLELDIHYRDFPDNVSIDQLLSPHPGVLKQSSLTPMHSHDDCVIAQARILCSYLSDEMRRRTESSFSVSERKNQTLTAPK